MATVLALDRDVVVSHAHAARLWRLPSPVGGWPPLSVTASDGPTRHRDDMHVLVAPCSDDEVTTDPQGVPVTTLARTVADCLRSLRPYDALAIADAARRRHALSASDLGAALNRQRGWPGIVRARVVADLIDARRESPLESWSAWAFHVNGVPSPTWQVNVSTSRGLFVARVDTWWPAGVAGEADGRVKYRLAAEERAGADAERLAEVLAQERERERRLRRLGVEIVRWGASEVLSGSDAIVLADHLAEVLARASRERRFSGRIDVPPLMLRGATWMGPESGP